MEALPAEESVSGATTGRTEAADQGQQPMSSAEAVAFLSGIEPVELQRCVFSDSLVTVSEGGRILGNFNVTVEFAQRQKQPCVWLHAQSSGAIDDCPCGTSVTAFLTGELEVLEENYREYVKVKGHSVEKRCHMVQRDGQMMINTVTTVGEDETKETVLFPMSVLRGLVTEGSSLLLMRLMALRKQVPEHTTFVSLDQQLHIVHSTFTPLGLKQMEVRGETLEVFGVERTVHSSNDGPTAWQSYFLDDGLLASRVQVGSPVTMMLLQLPPKIEKGFPLEEDMEMQSKFLDRKEELKASHATYLRQHPEIRALISDFLQFLLLRKPDDVVQFAREYFHPFASRRPPEPNTEAPSL